MYLKEQQHRNNNWNSVMNEIDNQKCLIEQYDFPLNSESRIFNPKFHMKKKNQSQEHFIKGIENQNMVLHFAKKYTFNYLLCIYYNKFINIY